MEVKRGLTRAATLLLLAIGAQNPTREAEDATIPIEEVSQEPHISSSPLYEMIERELAVEDSLRGGRTKAWETLYKDIDTSTVACFYPDGRVSYIAASDGRDKEALLDSLTERGISRGWFCRAGRKERIMPYLDEMAEFQQVFADIYSRSTHPDIALHLGNESVWRPDVRSWSGALGISQVLRSNYNKLRNKLSPKISWKDPFVMSEISSEAIAFFTKWHDSSILALTAYHAGPENMERLIINGKDLEPNAQPVRQYHAAINFYENLPREGIRDKRAYSRIVKTFREASQNYTAASFAFRGIRDSILEHTENLPVYRHFADNDWGLSVIQYLTGMDSTSMSRLNGHLGEYVGEGELVYTTKPDILLGRYERVGHEECPILDIVLESWNNAVIPSNLRDASRMFSEYADRFRMTDCLRGEIIAGVLEVFGVDHINYLYRSGFIRERDRYEKDPTRLKAINNYVFDESDDISSH